VVLFPAKDALHLAIEAKNDCEMFSRFELAQNCGRTIFVFKEIFISYQQRDSNNTSGRAKSQGVCFLRNPI
jgi:hypothetical protein